MERPIILTGPPRSGTTMMARVLDHLGVFFGYNVNNCLESWWLININEHILYKLGTTWDTTNRENKTAPMEYGLIEEYITSSDHWKKPGIMHGFKEPRYLLVMDVWDKIWDRIGVDPYVIRMKRHPMDIAHSLYVREKEKDVPDKFQKPPDRSLHVSAVGPTWPAKSNRLQDLETALEFSKNCLNIFSGKEDLLIEYEKFVNRPVRWLHELIYPELDLSIGPHREDRIQKFVSDDRAYAYRNNDKLVEFWESHSD